MSFTRRWIPMFVLCLGLLGQVALAHTLSMVACAEGDGPCCLVAGGAGCGVCTVQPAAPFEVVAVAHPVRPRFTAPGYRLPAQPAARRHKIWRPPDLAS